jgi:geranylgeranyl diphosphate synthase type II
LELDAALGLRRQRVERALERLLPEERGPALRVRQAMRYAVLGGGKRLRPLLAILACEACGGRIHDVEDAAAALEMIHTYSLIHDDLPAMDDDDLRRGRPTVHRAFDVATAVLAGDGLLTLAFEILGSLPAGEDRAGRRADAVVVAAIGAGVSGMVGGQMADLEARADSIDPATLEWIHRHKTGGLLAASAEIGAIHAGATPERRQALAGFGTSLGLAFQIADDILDQTSTAARLGKTPGKDRAARKATYPAMFGLDPSRREAERLVATALAQLTPVGLRHAGLDALARYVVARNS